MGLPALLAACSEPSGGTADEPSTTFDNWPEYIDGETVSAFEDDTGISMNYLEGFNDNNEYFAKIVPSLSRGKRITADILAPTFWLAGRLIGLDWVQKLPLDLIPNRANLREDLVNPTWDPTGRVHAAVPDGHDRSGVQRRARRAGSSAASTTCSTPSSTDASACSPRCGTRWAW